MNRLRLIAVTSVTLYVALLIVEQLRSDEPFDLFNLIVDMFEMALRAGAVLLTAVYSVETRAMRSERRELLRDLQGARAESARSRETAKAHVDGLSQAIAAQFADWSLTGTEADVAGLLLKGLSHKEIATLRGSSEATAR